ncbi:hypothetical protein [Acidithiobacillus ferrivorans]|jgi:hypothetical protein|uniref:Uncharacterized protein n=1 Tax=Acidithiobacillus ferrivorans TaxID=160808 RepID=A0A7T4WE58_9PROT|nr:hypothetical protein [Acidithiobacillus ferrivorans]QQD72957.1 hypothetical protein H2515_01045 [Acidithiobacillus ferrivorans]
MKANNIQNSQIADDPPLPTFWGEIRNFFTGLPDRWSQDTGLAHIDRPAECHKNITEEEGLPTLSGLIGSFCASHLDSFDSAAEMISDPTSFDGYMFGVGPFNGFSKSDDD